MSKELYKRYRPTKLSEVIGQNSAIATLRKAMKDNNVPHSILFSGPTGTGKTTLARILAHFLGCSRVDYKEINTADFRGIDNIRELRSRANLRPLAGKVAVYLIDECHKLTNDAQNAMLKLLEDTPEHVYFILGTSEPEKLIAAVHGRCTEIKLRALSPDQLELVLKDVIKKEQLKVFPDVIDKIVESAEGSARKALVLLEAVAKLEKEEEQLQAIMHTMVDKDKARKLALMLVYRFVPPSKPEEKTRPVQWSDIASLLRQLEDNEPEAVRYIVLGMARAALIGSKTGKAPNPRNFSLAGGVINYFKDHFYDSKHFGLTGACWEVFNLK